MDAINYRNCGKADYEAGLSRQRHFDSPKDELEYLRGYVDQMLFDTTPEGQIPHPYTPEEWNEICGIPDFAETYYDAMKQEYGPSL